MAWGAFLCDVMLKQVQHDGPEMQERPGMRSPAFPVLTMAWHPDQAGFNALAALSTARTEAVAISVSRPTPHTV